MSVIGRSKLILSRTKPRYRARSTIDTFDTLGYTFLYAFETVEALDIYLEIPSLVRMIIAVSAAISHNDGIRCS